MCLIVISPTFMKVCFLFDFWFTSEPLTSDNTASRVLFPAWTCSPSVLTRESPRLRCRTSSAVPGALFDLSPGWNRHRSSEGCTRLILPPRSPSTARVYQRLQPTLHARKISHQEETIWTASTGPLAFVLMQHNFSLYCARSLKSCYEVMSSMDFIRIV